MGASWTRSSRRSGSSAFAEQELARAVRRFGGSYELSAPTRFLEGGGPAVQDIRDNSEPFHCVLRLPLDGGLRGSRCRKHDWRIPRLIRQSCLRHRPTASRPPGGTALRRLSSHWLARDRKSVV